MVQIHYDFVHLYHRGLRIYPYGKKILNPRNTQAKEI